MRPATLVRERTKETRPLMKYWPLGVQQVPGLGWSHAFQDLRRAVLLWTYKNMFLEKEGNYASIVCEERNQMSPKKSHSYLGLRN